MPATVGPSPSRASTTAAPPSLGEHSMNRVRGGQIIREASTSSAVTALRNMASGLATPWRRFFTTTWARWSTVRPVSASRRWARRAKKAGAGLRPAASCHGAKKDERMMPLGIFSMPNTSTRSCCPEAMDAAPSSRAAPPEAQPASTS